MKEHSFMKGFSIKGFSFSNSTLFLIIIRVKSMVFFLCHFGTSTWRPHRCFGVLFNGGVRLWEWGHAKP